MGKHRYHYLGEQTVSLPAHRILAVGGDKDAIYESDEPINHPDFQEVQEKESKKSK